MSQIKKKFIIIDGNSLLHRAWHALPPLTTKKGELVNTVYGFAMILLKAIREIQPAYIVVTFDKKGPTFRHKEFPDYKAKRVVQPQEFYNQFKRVKELLSVFNIPFYEKTGFEADDVIGTISSHPQVDNSEVDTIIISGDLDMLQLVDKNTQVYAPRKGITDTVIYNEEKVLERYSLKPEQLIDFKALRGDPSDNIPGVRGIGEKGALDLIGKFGSLKGVYKHLDQIKEKTRNLLLKNKDEAFLSKKLVTIVKNLSLKFDMEDSRWSGVDKERVAEFFEKLGFSSLVKRIEKMPGEPTLF